MMTRTHLNCKAFLHYRMHANVSLLQSPAGKKQEADGNLFEIITSDETHYYLQAATVDERKDWIKAIQSVAKSGK